MSLEFALKQDCHQLCRKMTFSTNELKILKSTPNQVLWHVVTIIMPDTVKYTISTYTYTLTRLIAETGGWVGLFIGMSMLDLYDYICQGFDILKHSMENN